MVLQHLPVKDVDSDLHGLVAADTVIEWNILKLEIVTLLSRDAVRSPIDLALQLLQQRHMLRALDVGFLHLHHDPALRPSFPFFRQLDQDVLWYLVPIAGHFLVFDDSRLAVDMQPDGIPKKIQNEHGDMRVLGDVPEIGENAVAAVFGVSEKFLAQRADETGFSELRGAIALAVTVGRRHEQELLPGDKFAHQRRQKAQDLAAVKTTGPLFRSVFTCSACSPSEPGRKVGFFSRAGSAGS